MRKTSAGLAATALLAALAAGCAQPSPEERVAEIRGLYTATLQNFVVKEEPVLDEMPAGDEVTEGEDTAPEGEDTAPEGEDLATEGEGAEAIEEVPVEQSVLLDILIRHSHLEGLPGLTLEVAQVSEAFSAPEPDQQPTWEEVVASPHLEQTWRIYVDTSTIARGQGNSVVHTLEDVAVDPGDRFVVTVRHPVPPGERGEYREFAEAK